MVFYSMVFYSLYWTKVSTGKLEVPGGKIFLKQNSVGSCLMRSQELPKKSPTLKCGKKPRDARLKFDVYAPQAQNANFAPEGRRDFLNTAKLPQWPYLYTSYEATYALKRLLFEKIAKNRFMYSRMAKNRIFAIYSESKVYRAYVAS